MTESRTRAMHGNTDAGSRYLSLALLTRGAMNNLKQVAAGHAVGTDLNSALGRLLAGLRAQPAGNILVQLQAGGPDSSFEELATLSSLYSVFEAKNIATT